MELLAPSRRLESAYAAFQAGADAVYIGIPGLNARRMAEEVSWNDLSLLSAYSKKMGKKVYGALNIILKESEIKKLIEALEFIDSIKLDAVIFNDLAVLEVASRFFPDINLHASTQMFINNSFALEELYNLGVKRVVLPRELSYSTICEIKKKIPKELELEVFIHGALCHSVSGMCLFSGMYTGKSGNRGMCIQLCRKAFKDENQIEEAYFSMKDLHTGKDVLRLKNIANSLKIEGRLKSPEWTYHVVKYYRNIIDKGVEDLELKEKIKGLFSRETTKGELFEENPTLITDKSTGHTGLPVATVVGVSKGFVTASLSASLSVRDGIFCQRANKAFSLKEIYLAKRKIYTAKKGDIVSFYAPKDISFHKGDIIFKHSDNTSSFKIAKIDEKIVAYRPQVKIEYNSSSQNCSVVASFGGDIVGRINLEKYMGDKNETDFSGQYREIFEQDGQNGFEAQCCGFSQMDLFVRFSELKELKREFYNEIDLKLLAIKNEKITKIYAHYYGFVEKEKDSCKTTFRDRLIVSNYDKSFSLKNISEECDVVVLYEDIKDELYVTAAISANIDENLCSTAQEKIKELHKLGVKKYYALSFASLLFLKKIFKDEKEIDIHGGPFLYSINKISTRFLSERLNVKSFTVPYEFTLEKDIYTAKHFVVEYSEIIPLFFNCKSERGKGSYFNKEFSGPFEKVYSKYWGDSVLYSKKPFDIKTVKKLGVGLQREIRFYGGERGENIKKPNSTNYSFVIY